jgi:hypothetical protein
MRLPLTTTRPEGDRHIVCQDLDRVFLARFKLDDGAAAEAQHLVHRHGRGAEDDRYVEGDLFEDGQGQMILAQSLESTARPPDSCTRMVSA